MSEMQDAVQVIRVTYEGLEMFFKVGSGGYRALKDMAGMLKKLLDQEKLEGRTSVRQLLKKEAICRSFLLIPGICQK